MSGEVARPRCGVVKGGRPPCGLPAGWGTDHVGAGPCRKHGGGLPGVSRKAKRELAMGVLAIYGLPRKVQPEWALLEELWRTAGVIAALEQVLAAMPREDLVFGVSEVKTGLIGGDGNEGEGGGDEREIPVSVTRKAAPSVWLQLFQWEREHFRKLGVDMVKLGLEHRRDEHQRAQLDALAGLLLSPELALTDVQRLALARLMRSMSDDAGEASELREIESGGGRG